MDSLSTMSLDPNKKTTKWQAPEKAGGMAVLLGAGAIVLYFWGVIVPFILKMLEDTVETLILASVVAAFVAVVSNKKFRTAISYLFRIFLRKTIGMVITIDPIEVMKISIESAKKQKNGIDDHITELVGEEEKLENNIAQNNKDIEHHLAMANEAKRLNKPEAAQLAVMEAGGKQDINKELLPLEGKMKQVIAFMQQVSKAADFNIKKSEIQVRLLQQKYSMVNSAWAGLSSAMKLFSGGTTDALMYEQAATYISDDIAKKTGEMKRAMELSTEFIDNMDIERGVYSDKGFDLLEQFNNGGLQLLSDYKPENGQVLVNNFLTPRAQVLATNSNSDKILLG